MWSYLDRLDLDSHHLNCCFGLNALLAMVSRRHLTLQSPCFSLSCDKYLESEQLFLVLCCDGGNEKEGKERRILNFKDYSAKGLTKGQTRPRQ